MLRHDTIAAVATAPGRAGIGVVRISGHDLKPFTEALAGRALAPRRAVLTAYRDAAGAPIDEGIALYFQAPRSYTGEDVLEIQAHGGPVVLRLLLQRCLELGARIAEPGEFTRRAFLNGKLDLAQAEGVADLIDAATAEAARCAVRSLQGEFSRRIHALSASLVELRTLVEATLDFPDEDVDTVDDEAVSRQVQQLRAAVQTLLERATQGSLLREGIHVALAGRPNVGKSSLLNQLAGEEIAIVTDIPGTTRDLVRQVVDVQGIPTRIIDTAGLREARDPVERIGVARAWQAIAEADVVVMLVDAAGGVSPADTAIIDRVPARVPRVRVMNKIDLLGRAASLEIQGAETVVWLSAKTGEGISLLRDALVKAIGWEGRSDSVFIARERHLSALRGTAENLHAAQDRVATLDLCAEHLRLAHACLCSITGEFTADDLLGEIFGRFCIGK
jgi:tRNA modification GTPase